MDSLFEEDQPLIPFHIVLAMVMAAPIVILLMVFVLPMGFDEQGKMIMLCMAVLIPVMNLIAFRVVVRVRTTVTYDSVILKNRLPIAVADIDTVFPDECRTFKEFCDQNGHTPFCMLPPFGNPKGLRFKMKDGTFGFVGSQKPIEFENAVRTALRQAKRNEE